MNQAGLWELFFLTGLPQAWLAIRGTREEEDTAAAAMGSQKEEPVSS